jgi:chemotaxis protein methyltransferase CheR
MSPITPSEFQQIQQLLCEECGVYLQDSQAYLVQTRLSRFAKNLGLQSFSELIACLRHDAKKLLPSIINLMTTNETWWFRDDSCWNALEKSILPQCLAKLIADEHYMVRIWIAGCSTGQEAYSLAMLIDELCPPALLPRFQIEAMDISETALMTASHGVYNQAQMQRGLSQARRDVYFAEIEKNHWQLHAKIRQSVVFKPINLVHDFSQLGRFDLILCRNVTIYFTSQLRHQILLAMTQMLRSQGALLIGASEAWGRCSDFATQEFENCVYFKAS